MKFNGNNNDDDDDDDDYDDDHDDDDDVSYILRYVPFLLRAIVWQVLVVEEFQRLAEFQR